MKRGAQTIEVTRKNLASAFSGRLISAGSRSDVSIASDSLRGQTGEPRSMVLEVSGQ